MELALNGSFNELSFDELFEIDGGKWAEGVLTFSGGISGTLGLMSILGGKTIGSMAVGSCLACGPSGMGNCRYSCGRWSCNWCCNGKCMEKIKTLLFSYSRGMKKIEKKKQDI